MSRFRFDGLLPLWSEWVTVYEDEPEGTLRILAGDIVKELAYPYLPARAEKGPREGIDASGKEMAIVELIEDSRWRYVHFYFDWLSRVMPDTGAWRPTRDEWRAAADGVLPEWVADEGWQRMFGKGRGNPGFFNTIHDEHYPPLGSPPLIDLYMTNFRWWDKHIGTSFRPNFDETGFDADHRETLDDLNPAARFMLRVVRGVDERYTEAHCASVHREYARRQRTGK